MKRLYIFLLAGLFFIACEDGRQVDTNIDTVVYIVNSDLQEISVSESENTYELWVYKGGYNEESITVTLSVDETVLDDYNSSKGTSYKIIPSTNYSLDASAITLGSSKDSEYTDYITITFSSVSDLSSGNYVLPIVASCDNSDLVNEDKNTVLLKVSVE